MDLRIGSLAERPDLEGAMGDLEDGWPPFATADPVGRSHYPRIAAMFPECVLVARDASAADERAVIARGLAVPFALEAPGREELPPAGWDQVLTWAFADRTEGRAPDTVSAIEIAVDVRRRG